VSSIKKKVSEMTFKEFWEETKKKGASNVIEDQNFGVLAVLRKEGFSDEQINEMKMKKVYKLYLDSISVFFEQTITSLSRGLDKHAERASIVQPHLKRLVEMLEKWTQELEEKKKDRKET